MNPQTAYIIEAHHEHSLYVVVSSRCLRILNPWAIMANATSIAARP